jgi:tetratricopeptide (TPR) repeat protein
MAEIAIQQCHVLNIYGGSLTDARDAGHRALKIATELKDESLAYGARFALGQSYWVSGEMDEGVRLLTANLPENMPDAKIVRDFGTAGSLLIDSVVSLGTCHGCRGEFDRAEVLYERARAFVIERGNHPFDRMVVLGQPGRVLLIKGEADAAMPLLAEACEICVKANLKFAWPWQGGFLGYARALTGQVEGGVRLMQEAIRECRAPHLAFFEALIVACLAETLLENGGADAFEMARSNLELSRGHGYFAEEARSLRVMGAALVREGGDLQEAEAHVRGSLAIARKLGLRPEEAHALRELGAVQSAMGQTDAARASTVQAQSIYRDIGMRRWLGD